LFSRSSEPRTSAKPAKAGRGRGAPASDQSVIRFNPRNFDEAGELVSFLEQGRSLIMSLEEIPSETARRLLDFMSGIAYALNGKITPVSAKTYFITPENVDLLDAQSPSGDSADQDVF
jgi:cell division inhibitor SepF